MKTLLIVMHTPTKNTAALLNALVGGAQSMGNIHVVPLSAFAATPVDVLAADAIILGCTENLGYMSGALKDFFDRVYYPLLEQKQGLPCALLVRAGIDGQGALSSIRRILTGLRWVEVQEERLCQGDWQPVFLEAAHELGQTMAAGLEMGLF